jgi:hypothetical protein
MSKAEIIQQAMMVRDNEIVRLVAATQNLRKSILCSSKCALDNALAREVSWVHQLMYRKQSQNLG